MPSSFWDDLNHDMNDPEVRKAYVKELEYIARFDDIVNDNPEDYEWPLTDEQIANIRLRVIRDIVEEME